MFLDAGMGEGHHHGQGEVDPDLHPARAVDVMVLEAAALIEPAVDPLQCRTYAVTALTGE